jgi:uncharacterized protein (UPF0548 family)
VPGWRYYGSEGVIAREAPGAPVAGGPFERGRAAVAEYRFSDPAIVRAYFDFRAPLRGRRMLLELRALGLRYLCGVVVGEVEDSTIDGVFTFGYRYDTLEGHIERGAEWFLLAKQAETGDIGFSISAHWREGQFPNWWSRVGFEWLGPRYQRKWHHRSRLRLAGIIADGPGGTARAVPRSMFHGAGARARDTSPLIGEAR